MFQRDNEAAPNLIQKVVKSNLSCPDVSLLHLPGIKTQMPKPIVVGKKEILSLLTRAVDMLWQDEAQLAQKRSDPFLSEFRLILEIGK